MTSRKLSVKFSVAHTSIGARKRTGCEAKKMPDVCKTCSLSNNKVMLSVMLSACVWQNEEGGGGR